MNKKQINLVYIISNAVIIALIAMLFLMNITDIISFLKEYVSGTDGLGEAYDLFNEINRNITIILEIIFFNLISFIFLIVAVILTFLEMKFKMVPKVLKIGLITVNFLTVSYVSTLLINYGYADISYGKGIIILLSIVAIVMIFGKIIYDLYSENEQIDNVLYGFVYSIFTSLLAFGVFAYSYIILYKRIILILIDKIINFSAVSSDVLSQQFSNQKVVEQIQGYIDMFASLGNNTVNSIVSVHQKIEIISLGLYIVTFIVAIVMYRKIKVKNYVATVIMIVIVIILGFLVFYGSSNLVTEAMLGGCEVC